MLTTRTSLRPLAFLVVLLSTLTSAHGWEHTAHYGSVPAWAALQGAPTPGLWSNVVITADDKMRLMYWDWEDCYHGAWYPPWQDCDGGRRLSMAGVPSEGGSYQVVLRMPGGTGEIEVDSIVQFTGQFYEDPYFITFQEPDGYPSTADAHGWVEAPP